MTLLDGENYWEIFPNPIVMDKDDVVEVLDKIDPRTMAEEQLETYGDWFRSIPETVRDEAALDRPARMMLHEALVFSDIKGVYRRATRRNAEFKHLKREIWALQQENERLRNSIANQAAWAKLMEVRNDGSNAGRAAD